MRCFPVRAPFVSIAVGVAVAVSSAGCGAEDSAKQAAKSAKDAIDPVAQAAETTKAQDGGIAVALKGEIGEGGKTVTMAGDGVVSSDGKQGKFTLTTKSGGQEAVLDEIIDGRVVYVGGDEVGTSLPGGKKWLKVDLTAEAAKEGIDLSQFGSNAGQDPAAALDYLKGAGTSKKLGTETVNGTQTTRYHVDVDLRKAAAKNSDPDAKSEVEKLIKLTGTSTMPVDVWVDGDHLVRREQFDYAATVKGQKATFAMMMDFKKFGVDVDAPAPPADQVMDFSELIKQAGSTAG